LEQPLNIRTLARNVYRPDIYIQAAAELGIAYPKTTHKTEGLHAGAWKNEDEQNSVVMGADLFFDKVLFNPDRVVDYLFDFDISHIQVAKSELAAVNKS
jgi:nitrate/nitrite transport system substrate-binding protein